MEEDIIDILKSKLLEMHIYKRRIFLNKKWLIEVSLNDGRALTVSRDTLDATFEQMLKEIYGIRNN